MNFKSPVLLHNVQILSQSASEFSPQSCHPLHCPVLTCAVVLYTALYSPVLLSSTLPCTHLCCRPLHCPVLTCAVVLYTALYSPVLSPSTLPCTHLCCRPLHCPVLTCAVTLYTALYSPVLSSPTLPYTHLCCRPLHCPVLTCDVTLYTALYSPVMSSSSLHCTHPHMLLSCACSDGPIAVEVFVRPTKHAPETSESDLLQNFSCGSVKVEFVEPVLCSVSIFGEYLVSVCVCGVCVQGVCKVCACVEYILCTHIQSTSSRTCSSICGSHPPQLPSLSLVLC